MTQLVSLMKEVENGNFDIQVPDFQIYEINVLGMQFQNMLGRMDTLILNLADEKNYNKDLEMKLLLSQLNPHFLYNTLNSIYWMILSDHNREDIAKMVDSLSNMLRYGLYEIDQPSTVEEEIEHCRNYLFIQSRRYEERLSWDIHLPAKLYNVIIPKLTFQPIVENAIKHNINKENIESLNITINGVECRDRFIFTFCNDHSRETSEQVSFLRNSICQDSRKQKSSSNRGIGLYNVFRRLKLLYSDRAEMDFAIKNHLFSVTICIMKKKEEGGNRNESIVG